MKDAKKEKPLTRAAFMRLLNRASQPVGKPESAPSEKKTSE